VTADKVGLSSLKLNNVNKSDWRSYRFDEVAHNISERIDPNNTDLEVYVGLEHIDSESLYIKRFGTPDDVNGQKLRFYKGDVIFGRRRAYLRKAGIANCDGFCSAHALVLRANVDVIDAGLFPYFLHSDLFMNRAVDISVGSLSPTINWGTLKHQEFLIPPKFLHPQLARVFCALEALWKSENLFEEKLRAYARSKFKDVLLGHGLNKELVKRKNIELLPKQWEIVSMSEMFEKINIKNKELVSDNVLTISAKYGLVDQETYFNKKVSSKDLSNYYLLEKGDFAYNKSYSDGYPAGAIKELEKYDCGVVSPLYICMRPVCPSYLTDYFKHLFESGFLNQQLLAVAKEGARNHGLLNVSSKDFFNLKVPVPDLSEVAEMMGVVSSIEESANANQINLASIKSLQKSLNAEIF
jgi:restriction endonuclease S subunit